jgi:hypothetical protein
LEAVAILPQFLMIHNMGKITPYMSCYLCSLFAYRGLYILNWVYRYFTEGFYDLIAIQGGVVQIILYIDFYLSFKRQRALCEKKVAALPFFVEASEDWDDEAVRAKEAEANQAKQSSLTNETSQVAEAVVLADAAVAEGANQSGI